VFKINRYNNFIVKQNLINSASEQKQRRIQMPILNSAAKLYIIAESAVWQGAYKE